MPVLYQIGSICWFVHKYKGYLIMAICSLYIAHYYNIVLCQWLYDKTFFHHYRGFKLVGTHDSCQTTICISYFFFVSFNFYVDFFFLFKMFCFRPLEKMEHHLIQQPPWPLQGMLLLAWKVRLIKNQLENMVLKIHLLSITIITTQVRYWNYSLPVDLGLN